MYKMADSKTYLNVPFAQKDAAKALGARWDAANKKWYVPANKDITLFEQWQAQAGTMESPQQRRVNQDRRLHPRKPVLQRIMPILV